ncbi:MAG: hypothetical protein AB1Z23_12390 [Eubacteriales bacterium]
MDLIKKYIYAIQRRLPAQNKDDIAKEINSLIFDELEGKFGKKDEYTAEEIEKVIKEMGHPSQVAARYRGDKQLLIGPELYPVYKMVLAITGGFTALGLVISFIVNVIEQAVEKGATLGLFISNFANLLSGVFSSLLGIVGFITIIFALVQYYGKFEKDSIDMYEDWKPKDLPDLPEQRDRVKRIEPILGMFFITVGFVLLNYYVIDGNLPMTIKTNESITVLPIFSLDALRQYLPLWNLSLISSFALQVVLLVRGKWTLGERLFELSIALLGIVITATMINGPMIISTVEMVKEFGAAEWISTLEQYYYTVLKVFLGFGIFGVVVNVIKIIVQQARKANV